MFFILAIKEVIFLNNETFQSLKEILNDTEDYVVTDKLKLYIAGTDEDSITHDTIYATITTYFDNPKSAEIIAAGISGINSSLAGTLANMWYSDPYKDKDGNYHYFKIQSICKAERIRTMTEEEEIIIEE